MVARSFDITPQGAIARLDEALQRSGETIVLHRLLPGGGTTPVYASVTCKAFVSGYEPEELVGGVTQQDSKVILSPTQISAAAWESGRPSPEDTRVPMKGNRATIDGKTKIVEAAKGFIEADVLVRIEMRVRG